MTNVPRATVESVSAPYTNFLCPLAPPVAGVCRVCRGRANPGYDNCYKCTHEMLTLGRSTARKVGFVALAPEEGPQRQLAHELYAYKDRGGNPRLIRRRAAVLWRWLALHEQCLAAACAVEDFDVITTVPSSSSGRHDPHPLVQVASGVVSGTSARYRPLLAPTSEQVGRREFSPRRYRSDPCPGARVLLIDDTWTTGAHLLGAARALIDGGAAAVGGLALGRWYHPSDPRNASVEAARRDLRWSWETCLFCAPH